MKKTLITLLAIVALVALATGALADDAAKIKKLEKRLQKLELKANKSKINWSGDLRVEANRITGETADYYDGMALQELTVNSLFAVGGGLVSMPSTPGEMGSFIGDVEDAIDSNYAAYLNFINDLTFEGLGEMLAGFSPEQQAGLMALLMPSTYSEGYKTDNDLLYTTRLRLNMKARVAKNVSFDGRLSVYKPWGASTQVGVFNGQANTMYMDASEPGVPGSSTVHMDRAYFTWSNINEMPVYLSLGRRPSTDGPPMHYRHDEMRAGTPMGTVIDFQFDGATLGYNLGNKTTVRACYGLGYESQYGNGSMLKTPQDRLKDASFFGFNIDAWNTPEMQIQTTVARAFNITDGFNGMVIMPNNPVTGQAMPGPIMTRFSPSANLGEFDLASILLARTDGPFDWFVTGSWSKSRPEEGITTPFGGMFADPFAPVEEQTGSMYYLGARYNLSNNKTKVGVEWNKGSQYWFNFAPSQDDIIAPKTSTRGTVIEGYITHRVNSKFVVKLAYINYDYDYSGSGWHLGAPKELIEGESAPILGFPTYKKAGKLSLGFSARF